MNYRMLIINMGSTSTKVAVYDGEKRVWVHSMSHPIEELSQFCIYRDQYDYRKMKILDLLNQKNEELKTFNAFVSRGGTIRPVSSGTFLIDEAMLEDAWSGLYGDHPCNIGCQIAFDLGKEYNVNAYTVDPPSCNEMCVEATYSGLPEIKRVASFQRLNQRATARMYCNSMKLNYDETNLIVAHLGGGISVAAHKKGKIVDVNNALAGDGPFALERSGGLPVGDLIKLCYSDVFSYSEMMRRVNGKGGMVAYLKTTDAREVEKRILEGDEYALEVTKAMAYQVSKEIVGLAAVFSGKVDAILMTGGLAYWDRLVGLIRERISFIAPINIYPGENEMESLAVGTFRCLSGKESFKDYVHDIGINYAYAANGTLSC